MSRVGKAPIEVPSGVDVVIDGGSVTVKGAKGELSREFSDKVTVAMDDGIITLDRVDETRESRALHGLSRALLNNMVVGVSEGFSKELEIQGVGYRATSKGRAVELQVGFSHSVTIEAPEGITIEVPEPTKITVSGIDKEQVGQVA